MRTEAALACLLLMAACNRDQDPGACENYVDCVARVAPVALGEAQLAFGPGSECWQDADSAARCQQTCMDALTVLSVDHPLQCALPEDEDTGLDPRLDYREVSASCESETWAFRLVTKGDPTGANMSILKEGEEKESHSRAYAIADAGDGLTELSLTLEVAPAQEEPVPGTSTAFSCADLGDLTFLVCPFSDTIQPDCVAWGANPDAFSQYDILEWPP